MKDDLGNLDATAQAELVRRKELTPLELVDAAIARIEKINSTLNAVITPLYEKARTQARGEIPDGPFRGVPFLLKDLVCASEGDPIAMGMRLLRDAKVIAPHDTYLTARFRKAGFINLGKTNTPELGLNATTEPESHGPTRNPWDTARSTGGSSGGSAAAVSSRMVPVAHANDGGGSIRIPASECGIFGLKPTRGRVSLGPDAGDAWHGFAIEGVVSRSVRDTAAVLDVISGNEPGDPYSAPPQRRPFIEEVSPPPGKLRIGFMRRAPKGGATLHPDCVSAVDDVAKLLESLGHRVEESHPAALDEPEINDHFLRIVSCHAVVTVEMVGSLVGRKLTREDVELWTAMWLDRGARVSAAEYLNSVNWVQVWARRIAKWWTEGFDLLLTPTLAQPPPTLGTLVPRPENPDEARIKLSELMQFTPQFNATGQPAASVPLHWNKARLPIGTQFVAGFGREDLLIRIASQLEQVRPWKDRKPPICA